MQKFCGKCGNKLNEDDKVCSKCNTPTHGNEPKKMDIAVKILIIFGVVVLSIIVLLATILIRNQLKIHKMQKDYVEPLLKQNYGDKEFEIKYSSSGRCIISGDCYFDPVMGCDGGSCVEYKYLDDDNCKSYYYYVKDENDSFYVTVVNNNGKLSVVEGKNIYGEDKRTTKPITTTTRTTVVTTKETTTNVVNN